MSKLNCVFVTLIILCATANARPLPFTVAHRWLAQNDSSGKADNRPSHAISGRVTAESGEPIPNAAIQVRQLGKPNVQRSAATDEDGRFHVEGLARSLHSIWVMAPGYVEAEGETTPRLARTGDAVNIPRIKGGVITGTVTTASGEPAVAIKVRAIALPDPNKPAAVRRYIAAEMQTDDRGVYRVYGLASGTYLVTAKGSGAFNPEPSAYDGEAATYYPSATRDTAEPVTLRAGMEISGIDIRYRGERGHVISGTVQSAAGAQVNVSLTLTAFDSFEGASFNDGRTGYRGFAFYGIADGEYFVIAQRFDSSGALLTGRLRVKVKGQDVTGLEVPLLPSSGISGTVKLEVLRDTNQKAKCESSRPFVLEEVLITARRDEKADKETLPGSARYPRQTAPASTGEFSFSNIEPGRFHFDTELPSATWYVRALTMSAAGANAPPADAARAGIGVKPGERVAVNLTLAEGAASLSGRVTPAKEGVPLPDHLRLYLAPAEKESADDALRFYEVAAQSDGSFAMLNIAPGRYYVIAHTLDDETYAKPARPVAWDEAERKRLRQEAATANVVIEPQLCQRITDYAIKLTPAAATVTTKKKP